MEVMFQTASRIARSYMWSVAIWLSLAPVAAGEEKVGLLDRGLYLPYWTLLLVDGSWLLTPADHSIGIRRRERMA